MTNGSPPTLPEMANLYYGSARRAISRYGIRPWRTFSSCDDRAVFVVGSPRSATTFTAKTLGTVPGFADLGELRPLKRCIPSLIATDSLTATTRVRHILHRSQRFGQVAGMRPIEQTPETLFLIPVVARAFPNALFIHMVRDGRDVASSLIGLGWLTDASGSETDDVGHKFGGGPRFWVEPERRYEFGRASEATRAAWVWRRYESEARSHLAQLPGRSIEIRYEHLVANPRGTAVRLASFLDAQRYESFVVRGLLKTVDKSAGRWKRDLKPDQLEDILSETGKLLVELGYIT